MFWQCEMLMQIILALLRHHLQLGRVARTLKASVPGCFSHIARAQHECNTGMSGVDRKSE